MMDEPPRSHFLLGRDLGDRAEVPKVCQPTHRQGKRFKGTFQETFRLCQLRNPCITYNLWVLRGSWIFGVRLGWGGSQQVFFGLCGPQNLAGNAAEDPALGLASLSLQATPPPG